MLIMSQDGPTSDGVVVGLLHLACRDNQLDRRMTLLWESNSSMSIDQCAYIAHSEEWSYFAVQWSRECWGGEHCLLKH